MFVLVHHKAVHTNAHLFAVGCLDVATVVVVVAANTTNANARPRAGPCAADESSFTASICLAALGTRVVRRRPSGVSTLARVVSINTTNNATLKQAIDGDAYSLHALWRTRMKWVFVVVVIVIVVGGIVVFVVVIVVVVVAVVVVVVVLVLSFC